MNNLKIIKTIKRNPQQIVFVGFFIYAFSLGAMFPRLDDIQTSLEIDKAELGLLLLCIPLGLQVTLLFADRLVRAISLKNIVCLGIPSICFTQFAAVAVNQNLRCHRAAVSHQHLGHHGAAVLLRFQNLRAVLF